MTKAVVGSLAVVAAVAMVVSLAVVADKGQVVVAKG